jgi:hypothetical protein
MNSMVKYPRTLHVEGSNLQIGDPGKKIPFSELAGKHLVVEEKMDGSNSAVGLDIYGQLYLQSRGHILLGGRRETQFDMLKSMMHPMRSRLAEVLGERYVMFGEWLYARHTIYYDKLPSYFMEFDVWDRHAEAFLDTPSREVLLAPLRRQIVPVRVIHAGPLDSLDELKAMVSPSAFISDDLETRQQNFLEACKQTKCRYEDELRATDLSGLMEGLYLKVEEGGIVRGRYKFVRGGFMQKVLDSEEHWMSRPTVRNRTK